MSDEPGVKLLGFCIGIPGEPCGKRITENDTMAVVIPGQGPIGECCQDKLLNIKSWSSASPVLHNAAKGRGSGISLPGSTVFKSPRIPGSGNKAEGGACGRKYPK